MTRDHTVRRRTLLGAAATIPPSRWLVPACDALSFAYLMPVVIGGVGVIVSAALLRGHGDGVPGLLMRGGALVAVASLLVTIAAVLFPSCLAGPYGGIDPAIRPIWLTTSRRHRASCRRSRTGPDWRCRSISRRSPLLCSERWRSAT